MTEAADRKKWAELFANNARNGTFRCDTCHLIMRRGDVFWNYVTPCTSTEEEAKRGIGFWAQDPEWLICPADHAIITLWQSGDLSLEDAVEKIVDRSMAHQRMVTIGMPPAEVANLQHTQLAHITNVVVTLFKRMDPTRTYQDTIPLEKELTT